MEGEKHDKSKSCVYSQYLKGEKMGEKYCCKCTLKILSK